MILNRKSAKKTSKISLIIAVSMLTTIFAVLQAQEYPVSHLAENGMMVCKSGMVDILSTIFW